MDEDKGEVEHGARVGVCMRGEVGRWGLGRRGRCWQQFVSWKVNTELPEEHIIHPEVSGNCVRPTVRWRGEMLSGVTHCVSTFSFPPKREEPVSLFKTREY